MGYELDFLAVGEGEAGGDAIALRYGNLYGSRGEQVVALIDGGYADTGKALIDHLDTHYETDEIDLVISTHPDADHINGLRVILEELRVGELWMHLPDQHDLTMAAMKSAGWRSNSAFREKLERSLQAATDLEAIARRKGIPILEPFVGLTLDDGALTVVGPTEEYYESLLPDFRSYQGRGMLSKMIGAVRTLAETLWDETLGEDGETSPENNSCVITLLRLDGHELLLTADAGIPALHAAVDQLEALGLTHRTLDFVQVPHHGSKRNVSPSLLDRLLGPKGQSVQARWAVASVPPLGEPKHPAKKVTNAFQRRGWNVGKTAGMSVCKSYDSPPRDGWGPVTPVPFYPEVDD